MGQALECLMNEEKMLFIGLHIISTIRDEDHPVRKIADAMVVGCIVDEFIKSGKETFTEDETFNRLNELLSDFVLTKMVRDGTVKAEFDDDGNIFYSLEGFEDE